MSFNFTDRDALCRRLLNSSDHNERLRGVALFADIAEDNRAQIAFLVARRFGLSKAAADETVMEVSGDVARFFLARTDGDKAALDERQDAVVSYLLKSCYNQALKDFKRARKQISSDHNDLGPNEPYTGPDAIREEESLHVQRLCSATKDAFRKIVTGKVLGRKRGIFAIYATEVGTDEGRGFAKNDVIERLVEAGLAADVPLVTSRYDLANIDSQTTCLSQVQVAALFKVSAARVRQWMQAVRENLLKDSVLLREEAENPMWVKFYED